MGSGPISPIFPMLHKDVIIMLAIKFDPNWFSSF